MKLTGGTELGIAMPERRRFVDHVELLGQGDALGVHRAQRILIASTLALEPETAAAVPLVVSPEGGRPVLWRLLGADDTCRAIRTASFETERDALDDLARLADRAEELEVMLVADLRSASRSWWASLDGVVVLVSGRRWTGVTARDRANHAAASLKRLRRASL